MKNVLLVDDHSIVRQGLKNLIALEGDLTVTGEASSRQYQRDSQCRHAAASDRPVK